MVGEIGLQMHHDRIEPRRSTVGERPAEAHQHFVAKQEHFRDCVSSWVADGEQIKADRKEKNGKATHGGLNSRTDNSIFLKKRKDGKISQIIVQM